MGSVRSGSARYVGQAFERNTGAPLQPAQALERFSLSQSIFPPNIALEITSAGG